MRVSSKAVGVMPNGGADEGGSSEGSSSRRAGSPRRSPIKRSTAAAASSSSSYGRPRTNSMLKVDPKIANASGAIPYEAPSPEPSFSTTSATASSSVASHPFARSAHARQGNATPGFQVIDRFTTDDDSQSDGFGGSSSYGLGLGMPASYAEDGRRGSDDSGARWADIDDGVHTGRKPSWTNSFVGDSKGKNKVWLKAPKGAKRRVSDGLLSPANTSPPRSRRSSMAPSTPGRRRVQLVLARLPFFAGLSPNAREFVAGLLAIFGLLYMLRALSPAFQPLLSSASTSSHHQSAFLSTHLGEDRVQVPLEPPPDAVTRHPSPRMQQAAAVPLSPGRADKWLWKDKREELGSLIHYIAASDTHSLPALDPKKPIDPQLLLDFNPFSTQGPKQVSQMVNDFWTGKGEGASGQVLIIGRGKDPSVLTIRALIESLRLEPEIMFLDLTNRPDVGHLSDALLRILDVPRLPVLVIGGQVVGDFFAVRKSQLNKSFDKLLVNAEISFAPEPEPSLAPHRGVPAHVYPEGAGADVDLPPAAPAPAAAVVPGAGQPLAKGPHGPIEGGQPLRAGQTDEQVDQEEDDYEWDEEDEDEDEVVGETEEDKDDGPRLGIGMRIGFDEDDYMD